MNLCNAVLDKDTSPLGKITKEELSRFKSILEESIAELSKEQEECGMKGHEGQYGEVSWPGVKVTSIDGDKITTIPDYLYTCRKCEASYKLEDLSWEFRIRKFKRR